MSVVCSLNFGKVFFSPLFLYGCKNSEKLLFKFEYSNVEIRQKISLDEDLKVRSRRAIMNSPFCCVTK